MAQEPSNKPTVEVIKFASVELPKFVEKSDKDYVFYGLKNDYPQYLLNIYNKSTKHRAVVDGKVKYIFGHGWTIDTKGLSNTQIAQYNALIQDINENGESLDEMSIKPLIDWKIFGGFAVEVIWNKAGTKVVQYNHVPFKDIRRSKDKDNPEYYYTSKWFETSQSGVKKANQKAHLEPDYKVYKPFDPDKPSKTAQLFYYMSYNPDMDVYPLPEYQSRIAYVEIDIGISTFWNSIIKRGFTASHIITFMSGTPPTDESKEANKEKIEGLFGGSFAEETGGFIVEYASDKDHQAQVNTLQPTDMDKQYDLLNKTTEEAIMMGINPMLFGIKTAGQLGGRTEIIEANELFQNTYVSHNQKEFENAFNWLFTPFGLSERLKLTQLEPIGFDITNPSIWGILTDSEKRERIGLKVVRDESARAGELIDKISTLSPLVANKVIESMSASEIRSIVGLPPLTANNPIVSTVVTEASQFSKAKLYEIPTDIFEGIGESSDKYEELFAIPMDAGRSLDEYEQEAFTKFNSFAKKLDTNALAILDLLKKDPLTTPDTIARVIKKGVPYVKDAIASLTKSGYITTTGTGEAKVTSKGTKEVSRSEVKTEDIFVMYKYGWNPITDNSSGKANSRPFCKFLMDEAKRYSRKDIETLNAKVRSKADFRDAYGDLDINVWEHRGGWYRAEGSDVSVPQCRHIWSATIVRKK